MSTDQAIEQQIQQAGANVAPRITPDDIAANIASETFFTAQQGAVGAALATGSAASDGTHNPLNLLTFCVLVLRNGFTVTGESACTSPENFNAEIGRRIARENAVAKIWPLMGYELRSKLATQPTTYQDRVRAEAKELDERIAKLTAFTKTDTFASLNVGERSALTLQLKAMSEYSICLDARIQAFGA